jgi:DNA invertase Pin-like site-specific DNA recombinase
MSPPTRAALYARVSTTGKGQDPELQLDELRRVAAQRGWMIVGEFMDEVSGGRDRRPGLDRLMKIARAGKLDMVAVVRFDRFARSTRHLLVALEEFRTLGMDFVSLHEQVDTTTPMGRAMFTIIAAVAELEKDIIRERVIAGVRRAQASGKHCGRPRKEIDLRAARALLSQGLSVRRVADMLDLPRATLARRLQEAGVGIDGVEVERLRGGQVQTVEVVQKGRCQVAARSAS